MEDLNNDMKKIIILLERIEANTRPQMVSNDTDAKDLLKKWFSAMHDGVPNVYSLPENPISDAIEMWKSGKMDTVGSDF